MEYYLDLQYYGQVYSLSVSLGDLAAKTGDIPSKDDIRVAEAGTISIKLELDEQGKVNVTDAVLDQATEHFHSEHEREYGHADPEQEVQVVHARVFGSASVQKPEIPKGQMGGKNAQAALRTTRQVYFDGSYQDTSVYTREMLQPGNQIQGPAVIEEPTSTTILPPGASIEVDEYGNMMIDTGA